jgi:hypothetical protein
MARLICAVLPPDIEAIELACALVVEATWLMIAIATAAISAIE